MLFLIFLGTMLSMSIVPAQFASSIGLTESPIETHMSLIPPTILLPNAAFNASVSAFVSTITLAFKELNLALPIFKLNETPEEIEHDYFDRPILNPRTTLATDALDVLRTVQGRFGKIGYDAEIAAGAYSIGKLLNDKGLLPDVDTAIKKARKYVQDIFSATNELKPGYSWVDYFDTLTRSGISFLRNNSDITAADLTAVRNNFFKQFPSTK